MTHQSEPDQMNPYWCYNKRIGCVQIYHEEEFAAGTTIHFSDINIRTTPSMDTMCNWHIEINNGQYQKMQLISVLEPASKEVHQQQLINWIESIRRLANGKANGQPFHSLKDSINAKTKVSSKKMNLTLLAKLEESGLIETAKGKKVWVAKIITEKLGLNLCIWDVLNMAAVNVDLLCSIEQSSFVVLRGCSLALGTIGKPRLDLKWRNAAIYYGFSSHFVKLFSFGMYNAARITRIENIWGTRFEAVEESYIWQSVTNKKLATFEQGQEEVQNVNTSETIFVDIAGSNLIDAAVVETKWRGKCAHCDTIGDGARCCGYAKTQYYFEGPTDLTVMQNGQPTPLSTKITGAGMKWIIRLLLEQRQYHDNEKEWTQFDTYTHDFRQLILTETLQTQFPVGELRHPLQWILQWSCGIDDVCYRFKMRKDRDCLLIKAWGKEPGKEIKQPQCMAQSVERSDGVKRGRLELGNELQNEESDDQPPRKKQRVENNKMY